MQDGWESRYLAESFWFRRIGQPTVAGFKDVLSWAECLALDGLAVPPLGILADIGQLVLGHRDFVHGAPDTTVPQWLPLDLLRAYEDGVLGRLSTDRDFARAGAAVNASESQRLSTAMAFLIHRICARGGVDGVPINPALLKRLLDQPLNALLASGWDGLESKAERPEITEQYRTMTTEFVHLGRVLSPAEVFELDHHAALSGFSQRLALRQTLELIDRLATHLRVWSPQAVWQSAQVATHAATQSRYPSGGLTSVSQRGTMESLLQSQLMYMSEEGEDRPDLFDIKWIRDELLYYSRDDSHFFRPRVTYAILLSADLSSTRLLYPELGVQGILTVLASVVLVVRELLRVMSRLSLRVAIICEQSRLTDSRLDDERELLELLLRDACQSGVVEVHEWDAAKSDEACQAWSQSTHVIRLRISGAQPDSQTEPKAECRWSVAPQGPLVSGRGAPTQVSEIGDRSVCDVWAASIVDFLEQPI